MTFIWHEFCVLHFTGFLFDECGFSIRSSRWFLRSTKIEQTFIWVLNTNRFLHSLSISVYFNLAMRFHSDSLTLIESHLFFLRRYWMEQKTTATMTHRAKTMVPTTVATKMIGCLIFTMKIFRSIEIEFRTMTSTENDLTFRTLCVKLKFCWHSSNVVHSSHVSFPFKMYGPSIWCMQYSKFGEPVQKTFNW